MSKTKRTENIGVEIMKQYKLYTMDEGKTCCDRDDCCDKRDEARPEPSLLGTATEGNVLRMDEPTGTLHYAPNYNSPTLSNGNKIHDLVIKEMDLGYLVKVGCQTLCLETKERLIDLFTAYLNNPETTMDRYYKDKFQKTADKVRIGVVGYSQEDVDNHVKHNLLPMKGFRKKSNKYVGIVDGVEYELYSVTRETDVIGVMFDRVIETHRARENKKFGKIIEACNAVLKR